MKPPNELFQVSSTYWLSVFALSLLVTAAHLWRLTLGKPDGAARWHRATAAVATLILCLTAVDGLNVAYQKLGTTYRVAGAVAVIAITTTLTWLYLGHSKTPREVFRRHPSAWLQFLLSVSLVVWSSQRFHELLLPTVPQKPYVVVRTPGKSNEVHEFVALTDRNHPIHVYRLDENEVALVGSRDESNGIVVEYSDSAIQRAPASALSNCHGWLFMDGEFLISGNAVQRILDDNGYELVPEPLAGDIIIYRDKYREILHSGLVRGVLNDGTVIIESKWGTEGTFLHNPMDQPYSQIFEYFHSPRPDHRVKIVPADELLSDD